MLAPRPRQRISSPSSLLTSSATGSTSITDHFHWSDAEGGAPPTGRSSTRTSMSAWSDDKTEVPPTTPLDLHQEHFEQEAMAKEGKLIDLDSGEEDDATPIGGAHVEAVNPTQKLRELLREMEKQAKQAVPAPTSSAWDRRRVFTTASTISVDSRPRRGEIDTLAGTASESESGSGHESEARSSRPSSPRPRYGEAQDAEDEAESPPTPPPRIGNPYSGRRVSSERRGSPSFQHGRLPSRAAVLLQSTSRSPPPEPAGTVQPVAPTPLQSFLASHPSDPSSSRHARSLNNPLSSSSSSSSRKGKQRASPNQPSSHNVPDVTDTSASRRNRFRQQHEQYQQSQQALMEADQSRPPILQRGHPHVQRVDSAIIPPSSSTSRRPPPTPRRISVDLAPDDSASFIRGIDGALPTEMELDLDEGMSAVAGWDETSASAASVQEEQYASHGSRVEEQEYSDNNRTARRTNLRRSTSPQLSSRQERSRGSVSPVLPPRSRETSLRTEYDSHSDIYHNSRTPSQTRTFHSARSTTFSPPLPALPEPELSGMGSDEDGHDAYVSRRAALFRSSSKSASTEISRSRGSTTPSFRTSQENSNTSVLPPRHHTPPVSATPYPPKASASPRQLAVESNSAIPARDHALPRGNSRVGDVVIPPQEPIQVGIATVSTPQKAWTLNPNTSLGIPTPRPPGAWGTPIPRSKVRFSPLRREVALNSPENGGTAVSGGNEQGWEEGPSFHRLKVSPRKSPKKQIEGASSNERSPVQLGTAKERNVELDADTSWTARLSRSFSKGPISIPKPSTTLAQAQSALNEAAATTKMAQQKVDLTQKQWLEALTVARDAGISSAKKGWNWGSWAWWVLMELVLLWGVFRVTIDYATSTAYITSFDPFHPLSRPGGYSHHFLSTGSANPLFALGLPVPAGISTFVNRSSGSANFFDLLESWGIWSFALANAGGGEGGGAVGIRILGGVPT